MVARATKSVCRDKLRRAVFHFRNVEALHVDDEMKSYVTRIFQSALGSIDIQKKVM
jgi:hypothetical protein